MAVSQKAQAGDACNCTQCGKSFVLTARMASRKIDRCYTCLRSHRPPEYRAWEMMKRRCYSPKHERFPHYGGRGITVCDRWLNDFAAFLADVGPRPSPKHSLDRYPNTNGNYEPGNVRWATRVEQQRNRRDNRLVTHNGKTQCAKAWAQEVGISYCAIKGRLKSGWSAAEVLETPVGCRRRTGATSDTTPVGA